MNTYKFYAVARCPVQEQLDVYEAVIQSEEIIECEKIAKAVLKYSGKALFQESLAEVLAEELGVEVVLVGAHCGIDVVSTAYGP